MDKFSLQNIKKLTSLHNELEYEKATLVFLKLRVLLKEDKSYGVIRDHLRVLIKNYEKDIWAEENHISEDKLKESDLAEMLVQDENRFYQKRKEVIRRKLVKAGLNQTNLANILGHRKGYMSELINGLRQFSKEDIVIINRLLKIRLEELMPTFIKQEKAIRIKKSLKSISKCKIKPDQF